MKREYFVTISDGVTTKKTMKKTKSVQIEGETVVWDQRLDALYDFLLFVLAFSADVSFQFRTTVFTPYTVSLCQATGTEGTPYRKARDIDTLRVRKRFVCPVLNSRS